MGAKGRRRSYDPETSSNLYYQKIARIKAVYLTEDEAQKIAKIQADKWNKVFGRQYACVHNDPRFRKFLSDWFGDANQGVAIAFANHYLAQSIYTFQELPDNAIAYVSARLGDSTTAKALYVTTFVVGLNCNPSVLTYFGAKDYAEIVKSWMNGDFDNALAMITRKFTTLPPLTRSYAGYSVSPQQIAAAPSPSQTNEVIGGKQDILDALLQELQKFAK